MIETPVRGHVPPDALGPPPPDPRLREPDPPPHPLSRYGDACSACWAPVHDDQVACLNCGARVEDGDGGAGIRRSAVGSVAALLVLGSAVGAAVAGLPHGKHVPKPVVAQVFGPKKTPLPPATAGTNGTPTTPSGPKPLKPLKDLAKKPPPITQSKPSPSKAAGNSTASSGGTGGSGTSSNGGNNNKKKSKGKNKGGKHNPPPPKDTGPKPFKDGSTPASASVFTAAGPQGPTTGTDRATDDDVKTKWLIAGAGKGIMVDPLSGPYHRLSIISTTPGYDVSVYFTTDETPPADRNDWRPVGSTTSAGERETFTLPTADAQNAKHYLIWIDGLPGGAAVSLNEIQLRP